MIKDADLMLRRGCLNKPHLMKEVIARAPSEMKSMLLRMVFDSYDWDSFRKRAENYSWVAFPNNILKPVQIQEAQEEGDSKINQVTNKRAYCRLHCNCGHTTKECEIIKLVESKSWKRNQKVVNSTAIDENLNKGSFNYYSSTNPCSVNAKLINVRNKRKSNVRVLLATGTYILVINKILLPDKTIIKPNIAIALKFASGDKMATIGQAENLEVSLGDRTINIKPVVIARQPENYAILGSIQ